MKITFRNIVRLPESHWLHLEFGRGVTFGAIWSLQKPPLFRVSMPVGNSR